MALSKILTRFPSGLLKLKAEFSTHSLTPGTFLNLRQQNSSTEKQWHTTTRCFSSSRVATFDKKGCNCGKCSVLGPSSVCNYSSRLSFNPLVSNFFQCRGPSCRNYSTSTTQSLYRLNESNAGQLQPVLDIENILQNQSAFQNSVAKRNLNRKNLSVINELYSKAHGAKKARDQVQKQRDDNTNKVQELVRSDKDKQIKTEEMTTLKEKGRLLREQLREAEAKFNHVNDELVDYVLSLPNLLDPKTPDTDAILLHETKVPEGVKKWTFPEYTAVESPVGPGLLAEFPVGQSAWMDVHLREKAQSHLLKGGFVETGNAEYVKRIILQGAGIDHTQFLRIREPNVKKGWEHATYLAGGASFPSFLALFAQSIIDHPHCLPLKYFVIGRSYETHKDRPGSYQSHNVQAFVACKNEAEMEEEFEKLRILMESFYSTQVGFPFQTQIVPASRLKIYEKKKLAFVMNKTDQSPSKMVGTLSSVGDYVSKRLLCCYFDDKKQTQFLHLISAKFFNITHFLRTANPQKVTHTGEALVINENKILPAVTGPQKTNAVELKDSIPGSRQEKNKL